MRQKDIFEEGELLGQELDPLLQHLVLVLQLGDAVVSLLGLLPGLFPGAFDGLVVAGALGEVIVIPAGLSGVAVTGVGLAGTHCRTGDQEEDSSRKKELQELRAECQIDYKAWNQIPILPLSQLANQKLPCINYKKSPLPPPERIRLGVLQSLRIEGSHLSESPEFLGGSYLYEFQNEGGSNLSKLH